MLWDGKTQWRFDLHPGYKGNRSDTPEKIADREIYKSQVPFIKRILPTLGVRQMTATTHEADDMGGFLVAGLSKNPDNEIILLTGDQDWAQLIRPNVTWVDHRDDAKVITLATLFEKTGYRTPLSFLEGKALQGDSSDAIPGVGGIGKKTAPEFIAEFGSVKQFLARVASGEFVPKYKNHKNLASPDGKAAFLRNMKIMQLLKVEKPAKESLEVLPGKFDEDGFRALCEELCFLSILRSADSFANFIRPFQGVSA